MTTAQWLAGGLLVAQWALLVVLLRLVRSFGSLTERRCVGCKRDLEMLEMNLDTFRQLLRARVELEQFKQRESA